MNYKEMKEKILDLVQTTSGQSIFSTITIYSYHIEMAVMILEFLFICILIAW